MLFQQFDGLGQHDRFDAVAHVVQVPLGQHVHFGATEDFQAKIQVLGVVELAGQVILVERVVACLVRDSVQETALAQVIAPRVVAVAAQQCVIQVE
ncbi:hypothetical protein D3C71_1926370 [compost metagenome]